MATEPKQKTHELLTDYARQRREQAGPLTALDPHARARLQAEVARTFGGPVAPSEPKDYALEGPNLWLRLLWGGAGAALLVCAAVLCYGLMTPRKCSSPSSTTRSSYAMRISRLRTSSGIRWPNGGAIRVGCAAVGDAAHTHPGCQGCSGRFAGGLGQQRAAIGVWPPPGVRRRRRPGARHGRAGSGWFWG